MLPNRHSTSDAILHKMLIYFRFFSFCAFVPIVEEYTKISTPRQEVLFKKGSIGKKRPSAAASGSTSGSTSGSVSGSATVVDDSLNGNPPSSPTSPTGDVDSSFHYSGKSILSRIPKRIPKLIPKLIPPLGLGAALRHRYLEKFITAELIIRFNSTESR